MAPSYSTLNMFHLEPRISLHLTLQAAYIDFVNNFRALKASELCFQQSPGTTRLPLGTGHCSSDLGRAPLREHGFRTGHTLSALDPNVFFIRRLSVRVCLRHWELAAFVASLTWYTTRVA